MDDLVEAALEYVETKDTPEPDSADEFGQPECVVIGCGPKGSTPLSRLETEPTTVAVGSVDAVESIDADHTIENVGNTHVASLDRDAEIQLEGVLEPADFVIVTACSETPASTELAKQVCEKIDEDQRSVVIVLLPETNSMEQYPGLNEAAENVIPIDESHATEICNPSRLLETKRSSPLDPGEQVMVALIDAFVRTLHGPLPIGTDLAALHELFTDRGRCRLYYGAGHRAELPATVIDDENSGWLSDGPVERADGAFGFVRFGSPFELREFETVEEHLKDQYASQTIPKNRWVVTGTSDELFLEEFSVLLVIFGEE